MRFGDSLPGEDIADLANADCREAGIGNCVQDGSRRLYGKIVSIGRARKFSIRVDERPGNDATNSEPVRVTPGDPANFVQSFQRNDFFMCGNLQHRIRRGVENGMACVGMLRAEFFQNRRPATSVVADKLHARLTFDRVDQFVGKSGKDRKRNIDNHASDLPMTGGRVFANRAFFHFAEAGEVGQAKALSGP